MAVSDCLRVVMGVDIDEPRCDQLALGIDLFRSRCRNRPDDSDLPADNPHIRLARRASGAVDNGSTTDDQIKC